MVPETEPIWISFDWREQRIHTDDWGKQHFKNLLFAIHVNHNSMNICICYLHCLRILQKVKPSRAICAIPDLTAVRTSEKSKPDVSRYSNMLTR